MLEKLECRKCGATNNYLAKKGPHVGVYCEGCNTRVNWINLEKTTEEVHDFVMPFGKYKEQKIKDILAIDKGYLEWLNEQDLKPNLKQILAKVLHV